ncbi:hypothetical protein HPB50_028310 [Hyalomma asiaticum]|nr:hypothetical protein HPB50_028310 [Hyalomma asiaticum]
MEIDSEELQKHPAEGDVLPAAKKLKVNPGNEGLHASSRAKNCNHLRAVPYEYSVLSVEEVTTPTREENHSEGTQLPKPGPTGTAALSDLPMTTPTSETSAPDDMCSEMEDVSGNYQPVVYNDMFFYVPGKRLERLYAGAHRNPTAQHHGVGDKAGIGCHYPLA